MGVLVVILLAALAVFSPHLEQTPRGRSTLILAQYPFQVQSAVNGEANLFAQGLYSNLFQGLLKVLGQSQNVSF